MFVIDSISPAEDSCNVSLTEQEQLIELSCVLNESPRPYLNAIEATVVM